VNGIPADLYPARGDAEYETMVELWGDKFIILAAGGAIIALEVIGNEAVQIRDTDLLLDILRDGLGLKVPRLVGFNDTERLDPYLWGHYAWK
jgi:hypothetical protein